MLDQVLDLNIISSFQVDFIFKNLDDHLFLMVHNLDGGMLRGEKNQSIIARLASHPKIHLVKQVDETLRFLK